MFSKFFSQIAKHGSGELTSDARAGLPVAEDASALRKEPVPLTIVSQEMPDFEGAMDALAGDFSAEWVYARLGGLTNANMGDGQRVAHLANLTAMDELRMSRDAACLYHDEAIIISTSSGVQIGSLERHVAEEIAVRQRSGTRFACFLCSIHMERSENLPRVKLAIMSW